MIACPFYPLPWYALEKLDEYQSRVDRKPTYPQRVREADRLFAQSNREDNETFQTVRSVLRRMSGELCRCWYCEDSCANEIEHIYPKAFYPERTFDWENFGFGCGICNKYKGSKFPVFLPGTDEVVSLWREPDAPILPSVSGDAVLLDPRNDDPLDFFAIDILSGKDSTFKCRILPGLSVRNHIRAEYTHSTLRLDRDPLPRARASAYSYFHLSLRRYTELKQKGASPDDLHEIVMAVRQSIHQSVWREMKRLNFFPDLTPLFQAVPEALDW